MAIDSRLIVGLRNNYRKHWVTGISETDGGHRIALASLCLAVLILAIDDGVLNLALPSISEEFNASTSQLQWTYNAYLLGFASLLLTMAALGDRLGRKRAFHVGLAIFGISSLAAALSTSIAMLISARALMGVGGAIALPQTLSIIKASFPNPKDRTQAIGIWAGMYAFGYGVGPVVGGVLLEYFEWYSVFLINIPVVIIALAGGYFFIMESRDIHATRIDLPGVALSIAALFSLVYGIIKAGEQSWTEGSVVIWLSVGVIILTVFVWWEKRSPHPMLPLKFFKNMSFTGAGLSVTLAAFGSFAVFFFLSQYFQSVQGYSPLASAIRLIPMAFITMIASLAGSKIGRATGVKLPISLGVFIWGFGFFWLSFIDPDTSYLVILAGMILLGTGYGLVWSVSTDSIMGSVPESRAGVGSGMKETAQFGSGALGIAVLGAVLNGVYRGKVENLRDVLSLPEEAYAAIENSIQGAHITAAGFPEETSQVIIDRSSGAFTSGMTEAMIVAGAVAVTASLLSLFILPNRIRPPE